MDMRIVITGAYNAPSWETLQDVVRQTLKSEKGKFVRIAKIAGIQCDYHGLGTYEVEFADDFEAVNITVEVK